ncbi:histidine phosphatase [Rhizobium sp. AC44/96]|uniref:histidine phosphatase family protein n=1 Tax=Rhizobium sp. AC44/96 TaxID=1841654 RepID=UPI00080FD667|nr:histidine phosphatase family protein [Rhizobium sp. AC44/96]OCJ10239.1 histidine phosphatase [Rhizobium sp. AC44/96]
MMTRLTWICHGATAANRQARFPLDEPLEADAVSRSAAIASSLPRADAVFVSPALRARQTAEALGLPATVTPELSDCDYGHWAGRSITELHATDPDAVAAWMTEPSAAPHGGESIESLHARLAAWLELRKGEGGHTIAISHAPVIRAAIMVALQAPLSSFWLADIEPLALVRMTSNGSRWSLRFEVPTH